MQYESVHIPLWLRFWPQPQVWLHPRLLIERFYLQLLVPTSTKVTFTAVVLATVTVWF